MRRAFLAACCAMPLGAQAAPDYDRVFPRDRVAEVVIRIAPAAWDSMAAATERILGTPFGAGRRGPRALQRTEDPPYIAATVTVAGATLTDVGFRLKGNLSLAELWARGSTKLPFRLVFDRFADRVPTTRGRRLHGFRELTFAPGFNDPTLVREALAAELFEAAGVPAAATALVRVTFDLGDGPVACGVYTQVEVIDDTMVPRAFGVRGRDVFEPVSDWSRLDTARWERKTNRRSGDWTRVRAAFDALHDPRRTTDAAAWRAALERAFDADHFLRWLAASTAMVNWDSYGGLPHNYYVLDHPARGLVWIPWDHNDTFTGRPGVTEPRPTRGLSLSLAEVPARWPLIRHLMDDPTYAARYRAHLAAFAAGPFAAAAVEARLARLRALAAPHAGDAAGTCAGPAAARFDLAHRALAEHLAARRALVARFLTPP
jgi:hypothetical protein